MNRDHRILSLIDVLYRDGGLAFITENPVDIAYFTGCGDRRGLLVLRQDGNPELVVPAAALEEARQTCDCVDLISVPLGVDLVEGSHASSLGAGRVLLGSISTKTRAGLERMSQSLELCDRPDVPLSLQRKKEDGEIEAIRHAVAVAEEGVRAAHTALIEGVTELRVAAEATHAMMCQGAGLWFTTIVASGPRSCFPDASPSRRAIAAGDMCFVDVGPLLNDYAGDLTRSFVLGEPSSQQEYLFQVTREAQVRTMARVREGISAEELYLTSLGMFEASGLGGHFPHHAGHGLGLLGACPPFLSPGSMDTLCVGDVITIEPGAYVAGIGGCRVEDVVIVTRTGYERVSSLDLPWRAS
jgi:Xaa-Pro aminopeptidase